MGYLKEEIKAGIIIVTSLIILSGSVILIGGSQLFEKLDRYFIKVKNTAGLEEGSLVKLGGVRVGRILDIQAPRLPQEPVSIEIGVERELPIYKGTRALIAQVGFVGDIYLLLSVDETTKERFRPGDTIPSEEHVNLSMLMARLKGIPQSVEKLVHDINTLFNEKNREEIESLLENTNEAIVSISSNLDTFSLSLKNMTEKVTLLLTEVEEIVKENRDELSHMFKKAGEDFEAAEDMMKAIEGTALRLGEAVDTLEQTFRTADRTLGTVDSTVHHQSQNIDQLIDALIVTTEHLQELIQELKRKPWSILYKTGRGDEE